MSAEICNKNPEHTVARVMKRSPERDATLLPAQLVECLKYVLLKDCPFSESAVCKWRIFATKHNLPDVSADFAAARERAISAK